MGEDAGGSDAGSIIVPYYPRGVWLGFHESRDRYKVIVAHRRAGKTVAAVNEAIISALECELPNPRFGYISPLLSQSKSVAWDYVKHYATPVPGAKFNEAELRVDFPSNGGRVRLYGADNFDSLRGQYFDGVILDEFGDMDPRTWTDVIRPALSDRRGWAVFLGTPRGKNKFYDLRNDAKAKPGWHLWELKASETHILSEAELADARASMDAASYAREYECSFDATIEGAYYAAEMTDAQASGRICKLPIDPSAKVNTAWDIGIDDATAIWFFQDVARERRLIDYLEVSGEGLPSIAKRLDAKNYRYGRHIMPHDADAREKGSGTSYREQFESLGFRDVEINAQTEDLIGDIGHTRMHIAGCWFDEDRCAIGIEHLKQYRREWDGKRQTWRERPYHDKTSHAADAFRELAVSRRIKKTERRLEIANFGAI